MRFWDTALTGGKLLLLNVVIAMVMAVINAFLTIFGFSTLEFANTAPSELLAVGLLIAGVVYIVLALFLGGYIARKIFSWE